MVAFVGLSCERVKAFDSGNDFFNRFPVRAFVTEVGLDKERARAFRGLYLNLFCLILDVDEP